MKTRLLTLVVVAVWAVALGAQAPGAKPTPSTAKPAPAASSGVDTVIALVKSGMSEALVIQALKSEGKTYKLTPAEMLKLTNAGVSGAIIGVMTTGDGAPAVTAAPAPAASPAAAGGGTPFPTALSDVPAQKRRMCWASR